MLARRLDQLLRRVYAVFDYTFNRSRAGRMEWLGSYAGFLQADAYAGYAELLRTTTLSFPEKCGESLTTL